MNCSQVVKVKLIFVVLFKEIYNSILALVIPVCLALLKLSLLIKY